MPYLLLITPAAIVQTNSVPLPTRDLLKARAKQLADNPRPVGCKKLRGRTNEYRIRQGNYRVIYTISDSPPVVTILRISDRRDAYG